MTMLEMHADALENSNTVYHEFLLYFKATGTIVYGFVEGKEDPTFYRSMIDNNLPDGWTIKLLHAGNKKNVLKTQAEMDWSRFPEKRVCFFVDRDLSEFLNGETSTVGNVYITDNYSIENEVTKFVPLERVLEEILNITGLIPDEICKIQQLFECNLSLFKDAMVPVMVQIILWKRDGKKPCLDNIQPKDLFDFVGGKIELKTEFYAPRSRIEYSGRRCNLGCSDPKDIDECQLEFHDKEGSEKFVRGKYLLWFFVQCALSIHESIVTFCGKYSAPPKVRVSIGQANALTVLGPRVRIPNSLRNFIDINYIQYIQGVE
jgi:hypothetical protein